MKRIRAVNGTTRYGWFSAPLISNEISEVQMFLTTWISGERFFQKPN